MSATVDALSLDMSPFSRLFSIPALAAFLLIGTASPASADITAFLGLSPTPEQHLAKGLAIGGGLVIIGFEFEYSHLSEDVLDGVPALTTASGNVLVQTPVPVHGWQFYATLGGGGYRESLAAFQETHVSTNLGGGAKVTLAGPFRLRFDYRIFSLLGSPLHNRVQRLYAGFNVAF
jgi:hypothetical protein